MLMPNRVDEVIENGWILFDVYYKPIGYSRLSIYDKSRKMYYNPGSGWTKEPWRGNKENIRKVDLSKEKVHLRSSIVMSSEREINNLYFFDSTFDGNVERWQMVAFCSLTHNETQLYNPYRVINNEFYAICEQGPQIINIDDFFKWIINGVETKSSIIISGELNPSLINDAIKNEIVKLLLFTIYDDPKNEDPGEPYYDDLLVEAFDFKEISREKWGKIESLIWLLSNNQNKELIDFLTFCKNQNLKRVSNDFIKFRGYVPGRTGENDIEIKNILCVDPSVIENIKNEDFFRFFTTHQIIDMNRIFEIAGIEVFQKIINHIRSTYEKWDHDLLYTKINLSQIKDEKDLYIYLSM